MKRKGTRNKILKLILISLFALSQSLAQTKMRHALDTSLGIDSVFVRFSEAYRNLDALALKQLYIPEGAIIRHEAGNPPVVIQGQENIKQYFSRTFGALRAQRTALTIEFKTLTVIVDSTKATGIGYYKVSLHEQQGLRYSYGKFAVLLHKSGGQWYFITDTESRATEDEWKKNECLTKGN
jgi:ketosteroid isomerase-like protein